MDENEFKCFECHKTYNIADKGRYVSCVYCEEARHEYREQDLRDREQPLNGGLGDE